MSIEKTLEASENFSGFPQIEANVSTDNTLIFEEITKELEAYLLRESDNSDSTDGVLKLLHCLNRFKKNWTNYLVKTLIKNSFLNHCQKYLLYF